jgi:hypothetical protein
MNELITDSATGPTASQHRLIPIQSLLTDFTLSWLDRKQHRLPITTGSPNTHKKSIAKRSVQKQEASQCDRLSSFHPRNFRTSILPFLPLKALGRERSTFIGGAGLHRDSAEKESWN